MGREDDIAPEAVRAALHRIVTCPEFDASERNRRFLQYVVEETLAGRTERIKAYSIATSVFGREPDFDPQTDPIIRIEASRLRRSLERYYLTTGRADQVHIDIPKGSYVPTFRLREHALPAPDVRAATQGGHGLPPDGHLDNPTRRTGQAMRQWWPLGAACLGLLLVAVGLGIAWLGHYPPFAASEIGLVAKRGPAVFIIPFENDGGDAVDAPIARGFTREVIIGLTRFHDLFVFGPATTFRHGANGETQGTLPDLAVDFVVTGGVTISENRFRVGVTLADAKTGRHLWSDLIERDLTVGDIFQARESIANHIVQTLAQPYGIIFQEETKEVEGPLPQYFTSYRCMLEFYSYWRTLSGPLHATVQNCLERAVVQDPGYAEAYAALAMVYANITRYGFGKDGVTFDPLPKALDLAHRSIELAPNSVLSYKALHLVYWLMNDVDRSFQAAEQGLALNPNDSEIMADLGGRLCLAGRWERGLPLVQEAYARNPGQPGLYRIVTFLRFYLDGQYEKALAEAEKADIPSVIHYHVILAMGYAQLGRMKEAHAAVKEILKIDPAYGDNVIADLKKHNVHPEIIHAVVAGLRKAGLGIGVTTLG